MGGAASAAEVRYDCRFSVLKDNAWSQSFDAKLYVDEARRSGRMGDGDLVATKVNDNEIQGTWNGSDFKMDRYSGVVVVSDGQPGDWMFIGACR